jgi:hypothetical protein
MGVAGINAGEILWFKNNLADHFEIMDLGELDYILGIQVTRNRADRKIYLDQTSYINKVLARFGMQDCHPVSTPLAVNHGLSLSQSPNTAEEQASYDKYTRGIHYLSIVGSLLFVTQTRPDIQFAVGLVTQFSSNPGISHLAACKRILRYLKGTASFCLELGRRNNGDFDLVG